MIRLENIGVRFGSFEALKNINIHVKEANFLRFLVRPVVAKRRHFVQLPDLFSRAAGLSVYVERILRICR